MPTNLNKSVKYYRFTPPKITVAASFSRTENFTGTNAALVNTLTNWDGAGTGGITSGGLIISTNTAKANQSATTVGNWWATDSFNNNQYSFATILTIASGTYIGVGIRMSGTDGGEDLTGYLFYSDSADGCYIDKYVAGTFSGGASLAGPGTVFAVNDIVRLEMNGNALVGKVNGVNRLTFTDSSSPIASGRPGICAFNNGASSLDNWQGGDL